MLVWMARKDDLDDFACVDIDLYASGVLPLALGMLPVGDDAVF